MFQLTIQLLLAVGAADIIFPTFNYVPTYDSTQKTCTAEFLLSFVLPSTEQHCKTLCDQMAECKFLFYGQDQSCRLYEKCWPRSSHSSLGLQPGKTLAKTFESCPEGYFPDEQQEECLSCPQGFFEEDGECLSLGDCPRPDDNEQFVTCASALELFNFDGEANPCLHDISTLTPYERVEDMCCITCRDYAVQPINPRLLPVEPTPEEETSTTEEPSLEKAAPELAKDGGGEGSNLIVILPALAGGVMLLAACWWFASPHLLASVKTRQGESIFSDTATLPVTPKTPSVFGSPEGEPPLASPNQPGGGGTKRGHLQALPRFGEPNSLGIVTPRGNVEGMPHELKQTSIALRTPGRFRSYETDHTLATDRSDVSFLEIKEDGAQPGTLAIHLGELPNEKGRSDRPSVTGSPPYTWYRFRLKRTTTGNTSGNNTPMGLPQVEVRRFLGGDLREHLSSPQGRSSLVSPSIPDLPETSFDDSSNRQVTAVVVSARGRGVSEA